VGRGAGTGRQFDFDPLIAATAPGGLNYWYDKEDPNWVYLVNARDDRFKYPLSFILGIAPAPTPAGVDTQPAKLGTSRNITAAALGNPVGVLYGEDRVAGDVFFGPRKIDNTSVVAGYGISEGECTSLQKTEFQDRTVAYPNAPFYGAVQTTFYPGLDAPPAADPWFVSAAGGSAATFERYPGLCFVALKYSVANGADQSLPDELDPRFTVRGVKPFDPRLGLVGGVPSTRGWTQNPMLCLADYMTSTIYGWSVPLSMIDWTSVTTIANWCDDLVNGRKRFTFNTTLRRDVSHRENIDFIRSHFRCTWAMVGGKIKFYVDAPGASVVTFDYTNSRPVDRDSKKIDDIPTQVIYEWIDPSKKYQPSEAKDSYSTSTERIARYNGEACRDAGEAQSQADYYYLKRRNPRFGSLTYHKPLRGLKLEIYDIATINLPALNLNNYLARIVRISRTPQSVFVIDWEAYDATIYGHPALASEALPSTSVIRPTDQPPAPTVYSYTESAPYKLQGGSWHTDTTITWTPAAWPFYDYTRVKVSRNGGAAVILGEVATGPLFIKGTDDLANYTVTFETVSTRGLTSPVASLNFTTLGVTGAPPEVVDLSANGYWQQPQVRSTTRYGAALWSQTNLTGFVGANLDDGNIGTTCFSIPANTSCQLILDATAGRSFREVTLYTAGAPTAWSIPGATNVYFSDTGTAGPWTNVSTYILSSPVSFDAGGGAWGTTIAWSNSAGTHRYWRITFGEFSDIAATTMRDVHFAEYTGVFDQIREYRVYDYRDGTKRLWDTYAPSALPTATKPIQVSSITTITTSSWNTSGGSQLDFIVTVVGANGAESNGVRASMFAAWAASGGKAPYLPQVSNSLVLVTGLNSDISIDGGGLQIATGPSGPFSIGGFSTPSPAGMWVPVQYSGAQIVTVVNQSSSSLAANRIVTGTGADVSFYGPVTLMFWYNDTDQRWYLVDLTVSPSHTTDILRGFVASKALGEVVSAADGGGATVTVANSVHLSVDWVSVAHYTRVAVVDLPVGRYCLQVQYRALTTTLNPDPGAVGSNCVQVGCTLMPGETYSGSTIGWLAGPGIASTEKKIVTTRGPIFGCNSPGTYSVWLYTNASGARYRTLVTGIELIKF
jgi:hypothetical protein